MLTPHFHPRAVNWVTAISGNTTTYMYEENGAHWVKTQLDFGKATLFPRGSVHYMVNQGMLSLRVALSRFSYRNFHSASELLTRPNLYHSILSH